VWIELFARHAIGLCLVFAALLAMAVGPGVAAEANTDRPGSDYKPPIQLEFKQNSFLTFEAECEGLCKNEGRCRAWTMVKPGVQGQKALCYLKDRIPTARKNNCCASGTVGDLSGLEPATNRPGKDYRDFSIRDADLRNQPELACKAACQKEDQCRAWTYVWQGANSAGHCWLKKEAPAARADDCCISGTVARMDPQEVADRNPKGKTFAECDASYGRNMNLCTARYGGNVVMKMNCDVEMTTLRGVCLQIAAQNDAKPPPDGGVPAEWAATLKLHNAKRKIHGTPALKWNATLADQAQAWANQCGFTHDDFDGFGENLYWGSNANGSDATEWWYAEVKFYDWNNPIESFNQGIADRSRETRHFTQVVWKATTTLGCGIQQCGDRKYVVCRYKPQGNFNAMNPGVLQDMVPPKR